MSMKYYQPLLLVLITISTIYSQNTIFPSGIIHPFEMEEGEAINFPLIKAKVAGDINGDGKDDLLFTNWVGDERTDFVGDAIRKSIISTESGYNNSSTINYGNYLTAIGDYNGDNYDDLFCEYNKTIYFGGNDGLSGDSLILEYPSHFTECFYLGDINGDGYSEFFIEKGSGILDSILIFSGKTTEMLVYNGFLSIGNWRYLSYDYDNDGDVEFCILMPHYASNYYEVKYYYLTDDELVLENTIDIDFINQPKHEYTSTFSDINGDGIMDMTHVYYIEGTYMKYGIEVNIGLSDYPYFSEPYEIEIKDRSRLLYNGGDFNNDNADDWYSIHNADSIVVYFGNEDILTNGFQTEYYYTGDNVLMMPQGDQWTTNGGSFLVCEDVKPLYYNDDTISDLYFDYYSYDENLQFDFVGTAVVLGGENPDFENPILIGRSGDKTYKNREYGSSIKNIGDYNQDGYDDWGILAKEGCYLDIFYGGPEIDFEPDVKFYLPQTNIAKSYSWSHGDLNGDGYIDIVISNSSIFEIRWMKNFIDERDNVYIFYGDSTQQEVYNYQDADVILEDLDDRFYEFGKNVEIVSGYNGDNKDELIVGGGYNKLSKRQFYLYWGGSNISDTPDVIFTSPGDQYWTFANPIVSCGDINDDGYSDFTIGDQSKNSSWVYFGGQLPVTDNNLEINSPGSSYFGTNTNENQGDLNGDGINDLIYYRYPGKTIDVYYGGNEFDATPDVSIQDYNFSSYYVFMDFVHSIEGNQNSDIIVKYKNEKNYNFHIFKGGEVPSTQENFLLANDYAHREGSMTSGDFNNDGIYEIFGSTYKDRNNGVAGGIVAMYDTLGLPVFRPNHYMQEDLAIQLHPNPTKDKLTISTELPVQNLNIQIYSIAGQLMRKPIYNHNEIDVSYLPDGFYFIEIKTESGRYVQKILKH